MDAETMIEKLSGIVSHMHGFARPNKDECLRSLVEVIAALSAQAKAEPVAWQFRLLRGRLVSKWRQLDEDDQDRDPDSIPGWRREFRPVYTAPPPDHAEALAEALDDVLDRLVDRHETDEAAVAARAALTRYKERNNG